MIIQLLRSLGKSDRDKARELPGCEASDFAEGEVCEVPAKFGEPLVERGLASVRASGRVVPVQFARPTPEQPKQPTLPTLPRESVPAVVETPPPPPAPAPAKADFKTAKQNPAK